jgi:hypothetical protein
MCVSGEVCSLMGSTIVKIYIFCAVRLKDTEGVSSE